MDADEPEQPQSKVSPDEEAPSEEDTSQKRPHRRRRRRSRGKEHASDGAQASAQEDGASSADLVSGGKGSSSAGSRPRRSRSGKHSPPDRVFAAIDRCTPYAAEVRDDGMPADIPPASLDQDGLRILDRLHSSGFEAYFVGGCVRDLLLGRPPKDFDISTSARPEDLKALFGNCRLIGRRFRLAHIYFRDGKIIEVSTFRAKPPHADVQDAADLENEDLLIVHDNVFGTSSEDAWRRDLTINGLFYDVQRGRVVDFVGSGLQDLQEGIVRTIGEPLVRLREDPVRILRAIRFSARFGFRIEEKTWQAILAAVPELPRCSAPRLLEEMFKFLRCGVAERAFPMLLDTGVLDCLLPPVARWIRSADEAARKRYFGQLAALDRAVASQGLDDATLLAVVFSPLVIGAEAGHLTDAASDFLDELAVTSRLPHRIVDRVRKLFWAEAVLTGKLRRKRSLRSFKVHPEFPAGVRMLGVHALADASLMPIFEEWSAGIVPQQVQLEPNKAGPKRRRRKRSRRSSGRRSPEQTDADSTSTEQDVGDKDGGSLSATASSEVFLGGEEKLAAKPPSAKGQLSFGFS